MAICKQCKQENKGKYELCYNCFTKNKNKPKDELSVFKSGNSKEIQQTNMQHNQKLAIFRGQCLNIAGEIISSNLKTKTIEDDVLVEAIYTLAERLYLEGKKNNWLNRL